MVSDLQRFAETLASTSYAPTEVMEQASRETMPHVPGLGQRLYAMDFPGLFGRRPLWDIVTITLLAGLAAISIPTLLPAYRRLKRHAIRGWKSAFV